MYYPCCLSISLTTVFSSTYISISLDTAVWTASEFPFLISITEKNTKIEMFQFTEIDKAKANDGSVPNNNDAAQKMVGVTFTQIAIYLPPRPPTLRACSL